MSTMDSEPHAHGHHHSHGPHPIDHHSDGSFHPSEHGPSLSRELPLTRKDKLIIRLKNIINHNQDHGASYRLMADEARELGAMDAARYILEVAEQNAYQNETLESALTALDNL